jgi:S-DNA-T family DNA segregation ATPase FtsK/SpoIIIE
VRIRAATPGQARAWEVAAPPGTTVGALAGATGLPRADYYVLGGRVVASSDTLANVGAADGALLGPIDTAPRPAAVALVVVDGPDTGRVFLLERGTHAIGRHPSVPIGLTDPTVGALHAEVHVATNGTTSVRDRSNTNGTWVGPNRVQTAVALTEGSEVSVGATTLRLDLLERAAQNARRADGPVNRPPRVLPPDAPATPSPPATPEVAPRSANLRNLLAMLVPSLAGVGLAAAVRPDMVVLALLAPIGALVSWLVLRAHDARTAARARKMRSQNERIHDASLAEHRRRLEARLRARHPDLAEVLCRVRRLDPRLWERRPGHDDFLRLSVGVGDLPPDHSSGALRAVPVEVDVRATIGIVGDRSAARGLARSLIVQVASHHGPADITISVWTDDPLAWNWVRWLPHGEPSVTVLTDDTDITEQVERWRSVGRGPRPFVVLDALGLPPRWRAPWRTLLDSATPPSAGGAATSLTGTVSALVVAADRHALPEQCATVICVRGHGTSSGHRGATLVTSTRAASTIVVRRPHQLDAGIAEDAAARLAAQRDPDLAEGDRSLPTSVGLSELVDLDPAQRPGIDRDAVVARWRASALDGSFAAPIGVDAAGSLRLDLVADGPHGLIAGTTGSGKSELLRSVVASFAATVDPERLAFVLVDYKGGSAFDGLATLPHVVDVVTDLDATSARRAVHGLEAEVHRRERALRGAGTADIATYHHARRSDALLHPMPRLVIVVDEFATLAQELPAFIDALVDIAQRGRSLGVHLLLATQRPAGAVKDAIRTNTNLRIALRVLDTADSRDVLGSEDAATIARGRFGRGIIRLGAGELRPFQAAYVSGLTRRADATTPLVVVPLGATIPEPMNDVTTRDLDAIVGAVIAAHELERRATPRRPWADPLPADLPLARLDERVTADESPRPAHQLPFALVDEPQTQQHAVAAWVPSLGNMLIAGMPGSGTTTALVALAAATIASPPSERADVYVITMATQSFAWLAPMHHVGAVIATDHDERVRRLLRMLCERLDARRRGDEPDSREVLVLVDGVGALRAAYDSLAGLETLDQLDRVAAEGPSVGMHLAFAGEHPSAVGHRIDRTINHRVLLRLGDRSEYAAAGVRDLDPSSLTPGAGIDATTGARLQVACATDADVDRLTRRVESESLACEQAPRVGVLPATVVTAQLARPKLDHEVLHLPLGIGDRVLASRSMLLHAGEHALVTGPARCGKSNVLAFALESLLAAGLPAVAIGTHRSRLPGQLTGREEIARQIEAVLSAEQSAHRTVVLVDDADAVDDGGMLERLVAARRPDVHLIAAARGDRLRSLFRHWTNEVRRSVNAVLLRPDDGDAEVVGVRLPRATGVLPPGRGWLVCDGIAELCQFAQAGALATTVGAPTTNPGHAV